MPAAGAGQGVEAAAFAARGERAAPSPEPPGREPPGTSGPPGYGQPAPALARPPGRSRRESRRRALRAPRLVPRTGPWRRLGSGVVLVVLAVVAGAAVATALGAGLWALAALAHHVANA